MDKIRNNFKYRPVSKSILKNKKKDIVRINLDNQCDSNPFKIKNAFDINKNEN